MRPLLTSAAALLLTTGLAQAQPDAVEICMFEEEDWSATLAACTEALAASDDPVEQGRFILHRALAHEELGDLQAARLDNILAGEYRPDWFRGYANAASLSEDMGDPEGQARWAQAAIDAEPENPRAYLEMIYLRANSEDRTSCEPIAERVIELLPASVDWPFMVSGDQFLFGNLGYCLQHLDRFDDALEAYLAADYLGLEAAWLHSNLSFVAGYHLERPDLAAEHAALALERGEPSHYDIDTLVYALVDLDDLDGALEVVTDYAEILDNKVDEWGTRNVVGWNLFLEGRVDEASTVMEAWAVWAEAEIAEGRGTEAFIWDTVAHIRAAQGDVAGAAEAFGLTVEFYHGSEEARDYYIAELGELGIEVGEGDAGLRAALEACAATGPACRLLSDEEEARSQ